MIVSIVDIFMWIILFIIFKPFQISFNIRVCAGDMTEKLIKFSNVEENFLLLLSVG